MTEQSDIQQLRSEVEELQTQLAFQEDHIANLGEALAAQQKDLEWMRRQWEILRDQFRELQSQGPGPGGAADEKPPHY